MPQQKENRRKNKDLRGWLAAVALFLGFMLPREILAQPLAADTPIAPTTVQTAPCP